MNVTVNIKGANEAVAKVLEAVGPQAKHALFSTAAEGVGNFVKDHVRRAATYRHKTASALGASATGHLSKGARAITWHSSATQATVAVPIAGISRAWHDLDIFPVNAKKLTVPTDQLSYGRRVKEVTALGWKVFRPKAHDVLMGKRNGETRVLYALKKEVHIPQDPELLPTGQKGQSLLIQ